VTPNVQQIILRCTNWGRNKQAPHFSPSICTLPVTVRMNNDDLSYVCANAVKLLVQAAATESDETDLRLLQRNAAFLLVCTPNTTFIWPSYCYCRFWKKITKYTWFENLFASNHTSFQDSKFGSVTIVATSHIRTSGIVFITDYRILRSTTSVSTFVA
jgi:hypothetical protein